METGVKLQTSLFSFSHPFPSSSPHGGGGTELQDPAEPTPPISFLSYCLQPPWDLQLDSSTRVWIPASQGWDWGGWGKVREDREYEMSAGTRSHSSPDLADVQDIFFKSLFIYVLCFFKSSNVIVVVIIIILSFFTVLDSLRPAFRLGGNDYQCKSIWTSMQNRAKAR